MNIAVFASHGGSDLQVIIDGCKVEGDFTWFQGYETIGYQGKQIYECCFHGSIIE